MIFRVWTQKTPPSASQAASEAGVAEAVGRPLWAPPGHLLRAVASCPAVQPALHPASEPQATVAMVARRASCDGCLFTWSHLPRPCGSLPALPSASFLEQQAHHHEECKGAAGLPAACGEACPPRNRSSLFIPFAQRQPPSEHTPKLTCEVSARTQDCQVQ